MVSSTGANPAPSPRVRHRMPCELSVGDARHSGLVLNLSTSGLFVQTNASLRPGEWVGVELPVEDASEPIAMRAAVVWRKVVPRRMHGTTHSGVGIELISVPQDYRDFVGSMLGDAPPSEADPASSEAKPEPGAVDDLRAFRVHVKLRGSPRSKALRLEAASEEQARARALNETGRGWTVIEVRCLANEESEADDPVHPSPEAPPGA